MSVNLSQKEWQMISAYLDGRLSAADRSEFHMLLNSDAAFNTAFHEIEYTRKLLRSLPQKRAPRNFTLSAQYEKKGRRAWSLDRFFGWASATAAVALAAIFAWSNLFSFQAKLAAPAPMAAMESSSLAADTGSSTPMIIIWGQPQASGRGGGSGGGGSSDASTFTSKGMGGGGVPIVSQGETGASSVEAPLTAADQANLADPSTLILGLPEPGTEGEILQTNDQTSKPAAVRLPGTTLWMIGLGIGSLILGILAILLRRR